jgi:hypothetical protein
MELFVIIVYSIILLVAGASLVYNVYTCFVMRDEFAKNPPKEVFIKTYREVKNKRLNGEI